MNTYYTVEEKYLKAVEKVNYGSTPKALLLLKEIVENDPFFARAHFQLGKLYYYDLNDYQAAGFHFKTCVELEPSFPDVYYDYLKLAVFLNMEKLVPKIVANGLATPGVCADCMYELSGLFFEKNKDWAKSINAYQKALIEVTDKNQKENIEESIERVKAKMQHVKVYQYHLTG